MHYFRQLAPCDPAASAAREIEIIASMSQNWMIRSSPSPALPDTTSMFPALGLLHRRSKWFGVGLSCTAESFSRRSTGPFLLARRGFYSPSTSSPFLQEELLSRNCGNRKPCHQELLKPLVGLGSWGFDLENETSRTRFARGSTATGRAEREVIGNPFAKESLLSVVELGERDYSMAAASSPSTALEPATELARRFWGRSQKEAYASLYHPFVVALAGGILHMSAFQRYIAQDVYFLAAFAEAYGLASENADDEAKAVLQGLKHGVQFELDQVHLSVAGAPEAVTSIQPNPATLAYTEFLLGVARGDDTELLQIDQVGGNETISERRRRKIAAYTISAMTPCNRLYAFLGQEIMKALRKGDPRSSTYAHWIDTYASSEFGSIVVQCEQLLHRLAMPFPGEFDVGAMERLYRKAMDLEVGFFATQQLPPLSTNGLPVPVPLFHSELASSFHFVLISDFDSTCTASDSCPALADLSVAVLRKKIKAGVPVTSSSSIESLRSRWDSLVEKYSQEYTELLDGLLAAKEVIAGELQGQERVYNPEKARHVLEALAGFEIAANDRVIDSGVLSGLSVAGVKEAGGSLPLRDGCSALLKRISGESLLVDFHVLSVCWSRSFIEGSFLGAGLQFSDIHSNELQFNDQGVSTGNILRRVQTALDKEKRFIDIVSRTEERLEKKGSLKRAFTVYVGDSLTDLLCLLRADIGIVVGKSSTLRRAAETAGITLLPLYSGLLEQVERISQGKGGQGRTWTKRDGVLYEISIWHELHAFLLGS